MDRYAEHGGSHLVFTPPSDRGSLITHCEAYGLNLQRRCVPTLVMDGAWPIVKAGEKASEAMSRIQREWLFRRWGEVAAAWVKAGCPRVDSA